MFLKGFCTPCSYSARPYTSKNHEQYEQSLDNQLDWLCNHFSEITIQKANGHLDGYRLNGPEDRPSFMLQLAGTSSFFRDAEIPPDFRRKILQRMLDLQDREKIKLHVMLECRPEHLVNAYESGELKDLAPFFSDLNVVVNMGFEFVDDWLRNHLFLKELDKKIFEHAVEIAKEARLDPGIFVFAGGHLLTVGEILAQTKKTLCYLEQLGVFANIMIANLQSFTLPDLLWEYDQCVYPEPFFLLDIVELAIKFRPHRNWPITPFHWFIGGLWADPPPRVTLLDNPKSKIPSLLTRQIYDCFQDFIKDGDVMRFHETSRKLKAHPSFMEYQRQLEYIDPRTWEERMATSLAFAREKIETYSSLRKRELKNVALSVETKNSKT